MVTGTTILVWVLLAFASDLYAAGSVVATVGVVMVALAVLAVYLRMPQLFGGVAPASAIDLSKHFASAPKTKKTVSEPATGSLTSATGVSATPENVEPTLLHPEPIMPDSVSVKNRAGQSSSAPPSSTQSNQNRGEKH